MDHTASSVHSNEPELSDYRVRDRRYPRWDVFAWITVAYFLELGIAAHSFDQLPEMGSIALKLL